MMIVQNDHVLNVKIKLSTFSYYERLQILQLPVADPGGPQGAMAPPNDEQFFSHLVIQITDRFFE